MMGGLLYLTLRFSRLNPIIFSEIHVWTLEGDTIHTLSGHTSFVYTLSLLPSGDLVSGGEDRSVRVWKGAYIVECMSSKTLIMCLDGECAQVIVLPAISVWAVSTMPNGDIVAGTSDGVIRVFSEKEERWADLQTLKVWLFGILFVRQRL